MSLTRTWLLAARPKTLWAAISPVLIGTAIAYADGFFHGPSALAALLGAVCIQIGTNFSNDYFDFIKGADTEERVGPIRATQAGLVEPKTMRNASILVFAMAMVFGVYLVGRGGWVIVLIGLASILSGMFYTATRFALAYTGLADIFVLIFFGPVAVGGTYYVQALSISPVVLIAGIAPGLISTAILTVNNLRDMKQDLAAGKNTMAVRFGKRFAQVEYLLSLFVACLIPVLLYAYTNTHFWSTAAFLTFLLAIPAVKLVFTFQESTELNETLATTGKLLLCFSLIFSIGWLF
ncbi:MAG: 1,4-dihydroxy-2-naphthoate polyprenyltransferase [SAR324 cluster bacterium]|nr:1,4-dihydroxy-2-naphthoate polyprenyltransferase [SAR324 cluster bacterium]